MKVPITEVEQLLRRKVRNLGYTPRESSVIVGEYLSGELKGKSSHGLYGFIRSYAELRSRKRHFTVTRNRPAFAYIQGNGDIGQIVADAALRLAIAKARKSGIAMVGGGNIRSFLRPGTWAEIAARQGMISLCFNYGGGPLLAPTGAREPILSTNPIGLGIPASPFPIVIDMATSHRAYSEIRRAARLGKRIPADWAMDRRGRPTTDPNAVAAVLPFGGYKGSALALALEILTGPLVRTRVGKRGHGLRGFLFIVINPLAFTTKKAFHTEVRQLIRDVKTARKTPGTRNILIPGERAYVTEQRRRRSGTVDIDRRILETIKHL